MPQNCSTSSGPKNPPQIVNCATIKENEKLKETMVIGGHAQDRNFEYPIDS